MGYNKLMFFADEVEIVDIPEEVLLKLSTLKECGHNKLSMPKYNDGKQKEDYIEALALRLKTIKVAESNNITKVRLIEQLSKNGYVIVCKYE